MKKTKEKRGITLIALIITVIVLLILAGVAINAIVGDNGVITNSQNAKILQSVAMLEEQVNMKLVEKMDTNEKEISIADFSYNEYPKDGFLRRVAYKGGDTYVFDLDYINRISSDLKESLSGGNGIDGSIALLRNVYGMNSDFTVWYIDSNGKIYGSKGIVEIPIDPEQKTNASEELKRGIGVEGDLTVGDVRGRTSLVIDGAKIGGEGLKNLDELSFFPNITELTLKDLNLEDVNGLQC